MAIEDVTQERLDRQDHMKNIWFKDDLDALSRCLPMFRLEIESYKL